MAPSRAFGSISSSFSLRVSVPLRQSFITPPWNQSSTTLHLIHRRRVATSRRTTKLLSPTPWSSATPGSKYLKSSIPTIVFNPPPSAPTPYQTPPLFLPEGDPRRSILTESYEHSNLYISGSRSLPPPVREPRQKTYHLAAEQIQEIRKLRSSDPFTWTKKKLAEKFDCTEFFITMCSPAPKERLDAERRKLEEVKSRWGKKRREARGDRAKRRVLWQRDQ